MYSGGSGRRRRLQLLLKLLARMKRRDSTRFDGYQLARPGVPARTRRLDAYLKIAKSGDLDILTGDQPITDQGEKGVNHVF